MYQQMWSFMSWTQPTVFVNSTRAGVARVKEGDYAYLLESATLEYFAQRDCELMQLGGLLDSKGYGIGLPKGSLYTPRILNVCPRFTVSRSNLVCYSRVTREDNIDRIEREMVET